jgi:hypothetical protein
VRFLGLKVHLFAVVMLDSAMRQGPSPRRARELSRLFDGVIVFPRRPSGQNDLADFRNALLIDTDSGPRLMGKVQDDWLGEDFAASHAWVGRTEADSRPKRVIPKPVATKDSISMVESFAPAWC